MRKVKGLSKYIISAEGSVFDINMKAVHFVKSRDGLTVKLITDEVQALTAKGKKPINIVRRFTKKQVADLYDKGGEEVPVKNNFVVIEGSISLKEEDFKAQFTKAEEEAIAENKGKVVAVINKAILQGKSGSKKPQKVEAEGKVYESASAAGKALKVSAATIINRAKANKPGYKFI